MSEPKSTIQDDGHQPRGHILRLIDQARLSALECGLLKPSTLLVLLSLYRAFSLLDRKQAEELAPTHLTRAQWNALSVLFRTRDPTTMGELAEMMAVQQTNLSGIVKTLCNKGYVNQSFSPHDKRSRLVAITKKGMQFCAALLPAHWDNLERLMSALNEDDRQALIALLDKLVNSIRENEVAPIGGDGDTTGPGQGRKRKPAGPQHDG